jgi:hypothetical protein
MTHWGWYWGIKNKGHIARKLCSKMVSIDSFKVFKQGAGMGFSVQPLQVKAEPGLDCLKITYRNHKNSTYNIPIEKQPCNYGGFRYFFRCPLCQNRMRFLYLAQNSVFLCRQCLNLSYETQNLRLTRRNHHMSNKIKKAIKARGGDLDSYQKPPRMHQRTYQLLKSRQFYYECKANQAANQELRQWHGPKIEPYLDDFFDYVPEKPY